MKKLLFILICLPILGFGKNSQNPIDSVILLQNYDDLIPIKRLDSLKIASLTIGKRSVDFQRELIQYAKVDTFSISETAKNSAQADMLDKLSSYNLVIICFHSKYHYNKISKKNDIFIQAIALQSKVILTIFANPYSLNSLLFTNNFDALLLVNPNYLIDEQLSAQKIFGASAISASLSVSTKHYKKGAGLTTKQILESVKISTTEENPVDDEASQGLIDSLLLGFKIGDSAGKWNKLLTKYSKKDLIEEYNYGNGSAINNSYEYTFKYNKKKYNSEIQLNDLHTKSRDLLNEKLIDICILIDNMNDSIFEGLLENNFGFNKDSIIKHTNSLISEHNHIAKQYRLDNPLPKKGKGLVISRAHLDFDYHTGTILEYISEDIKYLWDFSTSYEKERDYRSIYECSWVFNNNELSVSKFSTGTFYLNIRSIDKEDCLRKIKKNSSYSLFDYLDIHKAEDIGIIDQDDSNFTLSFFPSFGRLQSGFDDRKISKVKYTIKIYNEWDKLIYNSDNMTHEFRDGLKSGNTTVSLFSNYRLSIKLPKEYVNSKDKLVASRIVVKIIPNAIILSDNSVVK